VNNQKNETRRRKDRQARAWVRYLAHFKPPADMEKVEALRRAGFDKMPLLNKQYVVRNYAEPHR
jgi:hypothetical protein